MTKKEAMERIKEIESSQEITEKMQYEADMLENAVIYDEEDED